jgi:class 3 adenylate cyclase
MGVHSGYVERTAVGYVGLEVHRAARVAAAANGGQILITLPTRGLVSEDLELEDLGDHGDGHGSARASERCRTDRRPALWRLVVSPALAWPRAFCHPSASLCNTH